MSKSQELVGIYRELVTEFGDQQFPSWATPNADVIQRMATSIFIHKNGHSNSSSSSVPTFSHGSVSVGEPEKVEGILQKKEAKTLDNGTKKYGVQIDGKWYSCFDAKSFGGNVFNRGDKVVAEVVQKGKYWNLLKLEHAASDLDQSGSEIPF